MSDKYCDKCSGCGFQSIEGANGAFYADACDCSLGVRLKKAREDRAAPPNPNVAPVVSMESAAFATEALGAIPFFPGEQAARTMIAREIRQICRSEVDVLWLVQRMIRLYGDRWPGPLEMRRVYCNKQRPLDGIEAVGISERFPDGIPSEHPEPTPMAALPAGRVASADRQIEAAIAEVAKAKRVPAANEAMPRPIPAPRIATTPEQKHFKPITRADVDRAAEEHRRQKLDAQARKEAGL